MPHDLAADGLPSEDTQLVEIFKALDGRRVGSHVSRGTATKIVTDEQTLHVLREAISYIDRVDKDGKFTITNGRNDFSKTYTIR